MSADSDRKIDILPPAEILLVLWAVCCRWRRLEVALTNAKCMTRPSHEETSTLATESLIIAQGKKLERGPMSLDVIAKPSLFVRGAANARQFSCDVSTM
jgi:hypothetical protein